MKHCGPSTEQDLIEIAIREAQQAVEIEFLRKETVRMENQIQDIKQERNDWKEQATAAQRLLENHTQHQDIPLNKRGG